MRRANGLNEYYSIYKDRNAPTISYPHVHVPPHGGGQVDIDASRSAGDHPWRTTLRSPSSSEVNSAVSQARSPL